MNEFSFYYRAGCSLCDAMHGELVDSGLITAEQLRCIDIDSDPLLLERYGDKIPVLADPVGETICHYFLDRDALLRYFAKH